MTGEAGWTTPADLRRQVRRLWGRGLILGNLATGETSFPRRLVLKRPGSTELRDRFDEVRARVAARRSFPHVRLSVREVHHRVSGTNLLPHEAWVETFEDAVALIRKQPELDEFRRPTVSGGTCAWSRNGSGSAGSGMPWRDSEPNDPRRDAPSVGAGRTTGSTAGRSA